MRGRVHGPLHRRPVEIRPVEGGVVVLQVRRVGQRVEQDGAVARDEVLVEAGVHREGGGPGVLPGRAVGVLGGGAPGVVGRLDTGGREGEVLLDVVLVAALLVRLFEVV